MIDIVSICNFVLGIFVVIKKNVSFNFSFIDLIKR